MWFDPATVALTELDLDDYDGVAAFVRSIADAAPSPVHLLVDARAPALRDDAVATYRVAHGSGLVRAQPAAVYAPDARTLRDALDLLLRSTGEADALAVVLSGVERDGRWALAGAVVGGDARSANGDPVEGAGPFTWFLEPVEEHRRVGGQRTVRD